MLELQEKKKLFLFFWKWKKAGKIIREVASAV
jgi:hypothetical protein